MLERVRTTQRLVDAFQTTSDPESLRQALGELHTLKGESRMLGLANLSELAHALETELGTAQRFSLALGAFDAMQSALTTTDGEPGLRAALLRLQGEKGATSLPPPGPSSTTAPETPPRADNGEPVRASQIERSLHASRCDADRSAVRARRRANGSVRPARDARRRVGRPEKRARHRASAKLTDGFERCRSLLDEATSTAWTLRLMPIEPMLEELARHARKAAEQQQKLVEVQALAGGVQLERDVADQLWDSLLHLVQNAVDHGLETPDQRAAKPPVARLRLSAESVGPSVVLRVEDDGRGIDPADVRRVAAERGVLSEEAAQGN